MALFKAFRSTLIERSLMLGLKPFFFSVPCHATNWNEPDPPRRQYGRGHLHEKSTMTTIVSNHPGDANFMRIISVNRPSLNRQGERPLSLCYDWQV
jgi:hypothetical protein